MQDHHDMSLPEDINNIQLIISFDVTPANKEEVNAYYKAVTEKINTLLAKHEIRNAQNKLEQVSSEQFKALLTFEGFFQSTPLKSIFFHQQQQFVPQAIIYEFRSIISEAPENIKTVFYKTFISLITKKVGLARWARILRKSTAFHLMAR